MLELQVKKIPKISNNVIRRLRIVLYSHDTMGLGHKRRNMLIAQTLASSHLPTNILMITGTQEASDFFQTTGSGLPVTSSAI